MDIDGPDVLNAIESSISEIMDKAAKIIKMLSVLHHHDSPWIELNPDNIEFVRNGGPERLQTLQAGS